MPRPRELNPRRAAVAARLAALAPAGRPVFRSGVDIDAVHYRIQQGAATAIVPSGPSDRRRCEVTARARGAGKPALQRCSTRAGKVERTSPHHPRVAAPDDRPLGKPAGAGPTAGKGG